MSTQALQTFHLVGSLALELQIMIIEQAFADEDPAGRRGSLVMLQWKTVRPAIRLAHPKFPSICVAWADDYNKRGPERIRIMTVCRLFRMVALQSWRRKLKDLPTSPHQYNHTSEAKKARILRIFEAIMDELKKKMEDN